jgi:hypothetical protein
MLLGVLAGAVVLGVLWSVRKCDLTPPCSPAFDVCRLMMIFGPCIDWLDVLASVAVGGTVAIWVDLRRRERAPR